MDFHTIKSILGEGLVADVEAALSDAAAANHGRPGAAEALRQLLIAFLAAAIITPAEGAEHRLCAANIRLSELVAEALTPLPIA